MELLLIVIALVAGAGLPLQATINATMGAHVSRPEWATLVNFAVGLVALCGWLAVTRATPPPCAAIARAPWWAWTGGLLGAFYVTAVVLLTPRLGVATMLALGIAGQMAAALLMDHFGLLGLAVRTASPARVVGAALLVVGVVLIRR